jgi:F-type H+-transporting ATPase subunit b
MGELSATILASGQAAAEGGGGQNFLIPNATFFVVLIIFLIVLGVIGKWVVPPISKVLVEREEMLAKTAADNRKSAEQVAAAEADYNAAMAGARTEASAIRDEARNEGRKVIDEARAAASGEVAETLKGADQALSAQRQSTQTELQSSVDNLSQTLASRILGVELAADAKSGGSH